MKIQNLYLLEFKRFTSLELDLTSVDPAPRLVLLVGANGSGKSSIFDAFEWLSSGLRNSHFPDDGYYEKKIGLDPYVLVTFDSGRTIERYGNSTTPSNGDMRDQRLFHGRSALRQVPRLTRTRASIRPTFDITDDSDRPRFYVEPDQRLENDIDSITQKILEEVFWGESFDAKLIKNRYLDLINEALSRIFGAADANSLILSSLIPPLGDNLAEIRFKKGSSEIHYIFKSKLTVTLLG